MAGETLITVVGNLTADPELRTTGNGGKVVNFTIASTPRTYNRNSGQFEDGETLFMRCSCWDSQYTTMASNIAQSLTKGMRVIAQGNLTQRSYQTQSGESRTVVELRVTEVGPSLLRATASVNRISNPNGGNFSGNNGGYNAGNAQFNNGGFQGGASAPNYSNGAGASAQQSATSAPSTDPWSASDDGSSSFGSNASFGGSADFGSEEIPF